MISKVPANVLLLKQVSVVGLYWGGLTGKQGLHQLSHSTLLGSVYKADTVIHSTERDPKQAAQVISSLSDLFTSGRLRPIIYEPIYEGLENVSTALTDLDERKIWGKGVVRVRSETEGRTAKL